MNSYVQLFILVGSFLFGVILYYLNRFNERVIKRKNIIFKLIISILYIFNMALLYVLLLYQLNSGVLHIYNVLFMVFGYIFVIVKDCK